MNNLSNDNIIHTNNNGLQYIQFKRLLEFKDKLVHAYTIGIDKDYRTKAKNEQMQKNYKELCKQLGVDYKNLVYSNQAHTDKIATVEKAKNFIQEKIEVDGLVTSKEGICLSTINADCILLLFYDPVKNVIANVHSGWRGTLQRISVKTIEKMKDDYECNPKDIICCISPSIRKCHFEVDEDVKILYQNEFKDLHLSEIIEEKITGQKWNIDTVLINKIILENAGLKHSNIIDSYICSVCNKDLIHSYRAHKENFGEETAIIALNNPVK